MGAVLQDCALSPWGLLTPGRHPAGVWSVGARGRVEARRTVSAPPVCCDNGDDGGEASTWHVRGAPSTGIVSCHHAGERTQVPWGLLCPSQGRLAIPLRPNKGADHRQERSQGSLRSPPAPRLERAPTVLPRSPSGGRDLLPRGWSCSALSCRPLGNRLS